MACLVFFKHTPFLDLEIAMKFIRIDHDTLGDKPNVGALLSFPDKDVAVPVVIDVQPCAPTAKLVFLFVMEARRIAA